MSGRAVQRPQAARQVVVATARPVLQQALGPAEAATFLGIGETFFRQLVADRILPRPRLLGTRRLWDVDELTAAFKALPTEGDKPEEVTDPWAQFDAVHGL